MRDKEVFGTDDMVRPLTRITFEVIGRNGDTEELVTTGIPTRGAFLAKHPVERVSEVDDLTTEYAIVDPTMFRDNLADKPLCTPKSTLIPPVGIDGCTMIFVGDVLYIGHTIRTILDVPNGIKRPSRVQLVILIDRGYRELSIRPDYVGRNLPTSCRETMTILLKESDGRDDVSFGRES